MLAGVFADYSPMPTEPIIIIASLSFAGFSLISFSLGRFRF
jgi:hypothetical protein